MADVVDVDLNPLLKTNVAYLRRKFYSVTDRFPLNLVFDETLTQLEDRELFMGSVPVSVSGQITPIQKILTYLSKILRDYRTFETLDTILIEGLKHPNKRIRTYHLAVFSALFYPFKLWRMMSDRRRARISPSGKLINDTFSEDWSDRLPTVRKDLKRVIEMIRWFKAHTGQFSSQEEYFDSLDKKKGTTWQLVQRVSALGLQFFAVLRKV